MCNVKILACMKERCKSKHAFPTMAAARREMALVACTSSKERSEAVWRVYLCSVCGKWHYTSHGSVNDQNFYASVLKEANRG